MNRDCSVEGETRPSQADIVALLYQQYAKSICAYLHSLVDNWDVAHDLTQETYLRLHQARDRLPAVGNQRAWVYRIATNLALTERKRRKRFLWLPWHNAEIPPAFIWNGMEAALHESININRALTQLSTEYRIPLLLYSSYGFRVREIAEILDLSESAVKVRLYRAREHFRQAYEQEVSDE